MSSNDQVQHSLRYFEGWMMFCLGCGALISFAFFILTVLSLAIVPLLSTVHA